MSATLTETPTGAKQSPDSTSAETGGAKHAFEVFFDGDCPLCLREINMLRRMDKRGNILFTDIAAADFSPADYGKQMTTLMAEIHGRTPDGAWVIGVDVFRHLYSLVGFAWAVAPTRLPVVRQVLDLGYRFFARYRLALTGRRCDAGKCEV